MTPNSARIFNFEATLHERRAFAVPAADAAEAMAGLFDCLGLDVLAASCGSVLIKPGAGVAELPLLRVVCDLLFEALGRSGEVVIGGRRRDLAAIAEWPGEYARRGLWLSVIDPGRPDGPFRHCAVNLGPDALYRMKMSDGEATVAREYAVSGDVLAARLVLSISAAGSALENLGDIEVSAPEKGPVSGAWPAILDRNRILLYADARGNLSETVQRSVVAVTARPGCCVGSRNPLAAAVAEARLNGMAFPAAATAFGLKRFPLAAFGRGEVELANWPREAAA